MKIFAALCIALALPAAGSAAIVQTFTSRASFVAAVTQTTVLPLALPGAPPVLVSAFTVGNLQIGTLDGLLAGDGIDIMSTELDGDTLILDFARPIFGVGLFGGVVDSEFAYFDGELSIEAVGSGTASLLASGGPAYLGLISDIGFTQLRVSVAAFDGDVSAIAFAGLQGQVDEAGTVPEPAAWALMVGGFLLIGTRQRTRRVAA